MNELAERMQQAYDGGGREEARQVFMRLCEERSWTQAQLSEAWQLLWGYPKT